MKESKKILYYLLFFFVLFVLTACNRNTNQKSINISSINSTEMPNQSSDTNEENIGGKYTIGWSVYNESFEYFKSMQDGVISKAKELDINVITHDQKSNDLEMVMGCKDLIAQGIDALLISPINPEAMVIVDELAKRAGIPVIVVDVGTGGADVEAFIVSDNFGGGILAGEYALNLIKEKNIISKNAAIFKVEENSIYARRRGEGFKRVISGYNIVSEITVDPAGPNAYESMKTILENFGEDLAVVFCENDRMALDAARAIDEAGKKDEILVIGFDGDPSAIAAIKEGLMDGTIAQQPYQMGELGVELANTLLNGGQIIYDDNEKKELYMEVYLIDETGTSKNLLKRR